MSVINNSSVIFTFLEDFSGLSTSQATSTVAWARSGCSSVMSSRAAAAAPSPPGPTSWPAAFVTRAPKACSIPIPPSVDALPPTPRTRWRQPASSAAAITSPTPRLVAVSGARDSPSRASPATAASSITASCPRRTKRDGWMAPMASAASMGTRRKPAASNASSIPSPPSATGTVTSVDVRATRADPVRQVLRDLGRGQRALELVRGEHHPWHLRSRGVSRDWRIARSERRRPDAASSSNSVIVVDLESHRDVRDSLEDHLDDHRHPVLDDQLLGLLQRREDLSRLEDPDRLAAQAFGDLDVVDAVAVDLGRVDVVEGQLHAVVHVEAALRLADQPEVGVVHQHVDVRDVELRADRQLLDHELEVVVAGQRDDRRVRVGGGDPERGRDGPAQRPGLAGVDPVPRLGRRAAAARPGSGTARSC